MNNEELLEKLNELNELGVLNEIDIIGYTQRALDEINAMEQFVTEMELDEELESELEPEEHIEDEFLEKVLNDDEVYFEKEALTLITVNGIKMFISEAELEKLEALEEAEKITSNENEEQEDKSCGPEDHENQTYMDFGNDEYNKIAEDAINYFRDNISTSKEYQDFLKTWGAK